jgi:hypothetical protein
MLGSPQGVMRTRRLLIGPALIIPQGGVFPSRARTDPQREGTAAEPPLPDRDGGTGSLDPTTLRRAIRRLRRPVPFCISHVAAVWRNEYLTTSSPRPALACCTDFAGEGVNDGIDQPSYAASPVTRSTVPTPTPIRRMVPPDELWVQNLSAPDIGLFSGNEFRA